MEPRLLLSADALGIDAGVLNPGANEESVWELATATDWTRTAATLTPGANAPPLPGAENSDDGTDDVDVAVLSVKADETQQHTEVVFLDAGVADGVTLLDGIINQNAASITQIYLIDASQDGIEQIAEILGQHSNIDAVHFISHGSAGQLHLGNATLSSSSLERYQEALTAWSNALSESADILIYGCEIAATEDGQSLVNAISILTGADVAASDDLTGSSSGGDWELEYRVGALQTDSFDASDVQDWQGTLAEISSDGKGSAQATAMDANGNYVVVYSALNQDGDGWGVYAQLYDSTGVAQGGEILVNQTTTDDQRWASVGMSDTGEFVVTWTSSNQDGTASSIYARQFNADGTAAGDEFRVNTENTGMQTNASIDVDAAGNFIIVWQGNGPADSDGVFFRRFNADGTAIDSNDVIAHNPTSGTTSEFDPVVAWQSNGKFVIAWEQNNDNIYFQRFDSDGSMLGGKTQIDIGLSTSSGLSIDANASGTFVVAYKEENIFSAIYVRAYNEDGSDAFTNGDWSNKWARLGGNNALNPSVAIDDSGEILVVYQTSDSNGDIHLQRINADGSEPGPPETVIADAGHQNMPAIAIQDVNSYTIAWNDAVSSGVNTITSNPGNNEQILSINTGATVEEGSNGNVITTAMLQTTDADNTPDQLVYTLTAVPVHGVLTLNGTALGVSDTFTQDDIDNGRVAYTHDGSENFNDSFGFSVDDGAGVATTGSFAISINPVNDNDPVADDESFTVAEGGTATAADLDAGGSLLDGDTDADLPNDTLTINTAPVSGPSHGALTLNTDGSFSYTHDGSENFSDSFSYELLDANGGVTDTATVTITVTPVNDVPTAMNLDSTSVYNEGDTTVAITDIQVSDTDLGETITATLALTDPSTGTLSANDGAAYTAGTGIWTITDTLPNVNTALANLVFNPAAENVADTTIIVHIEDAAGTGPAEGTIFLDVTPINDAPVLVKPVPDQFATEDVAFDFQLAVDTFSDVDVGDSLTYTAQLTGGAPLPSWLGFDADTLGFSGTPSNSDVGVIAIEIIATDSSGSSASASFNLTVNNVNDAPVLGNNNLSLLPGDTVVLNPAMLSAVDADHIDPDLIFTVSNVTGGQFELTTAPGVAITSFTQAQVSAGEVLFIDDGDEIAPAYDVSVGDGVVNTKPQSATVSFVAPPRPADTTTTGNVQQPLEITAATNPESGDVTETGDTTGHTAVTATAEVVGSTSMAPPAVDIAPNNSVDSFTIPVLVPDFDFSFTPSDSSLEVLLKKLLTQYSVQTASTIVPVPLPLESDPLTSEIRGVLISHGFNDGLNQMRADVSSATSLHKNIVATSIAATTGLSIGYIAWLIRGGVLLSAALSSLPAWQFIDPLPVLAHNRNKEEGEQDDSLEEIIHKESQRADKQDNKHIHRETSEASGTSSGKQT